MEPESRAGVIEAVESKGHHRAKRLMKIGIPRSTYYFWRGRYFDDGISGLERRAAAPAPAWNASTPDEERIILETARERPELPPRLLAVKITDEKGVYVSESTVYRVLKRHGLYG